MHTNTPITLESKPVLSWEAPARPVFERTKRWYIVAGIVVFVAATYGIFSGSWSLAIVCVLAGGMYALIHDHQPGTSRVELHDNGIVLNGVFTRWDEFSGYWILHTPTYNEVRFVTKRAGHGRTSIQMGDQDPNQLRMVLGQRLPELIQMKEGFIDIFIRVCKL